MPCDPFDAADWLARFRAVGGWYAVQDNKVHAGWRIDGPSDDERVREVWREIEHSEERRASIRAVVHAA